MCRLWTAVRGARSRLDVARVSRLSGAEPRASALAVQRELGNDETIKPGRRTPEERESPARQSHRRPRGDTPPSSLTPQPCRHGEGLARPGTTATRLYYFCFWARSAAAAAAT